MNRIKRFLGLVYFIYFHGWHVAFLWLACGPNLANRSRPPSAIILHSMWAGSMWPRFGLALFYLVYSLLTWDLPLACLWPKSGKQEWSAQVPSFHVVCGLNESVRCGPDLGFRNFATWGGIKTEQKGPYKVCIWWFLLLLLFYIKNMIFNHN